MYFGHDEKNTIWLIHILHLLESNISTHPCSLFVILQNICFISYQLIMIYHISEYHKYQKWLFQLGIGSGNSHVPQYFWFQNFHLYNATNFSICVPHIFTISVKHQILTTVRPRQIFHILLITPAHLHSPKNSYVLCV